MFNEQFHKQLDHLKRAAEQKEHSLNALRAQYERLGSSIRYAASHLLTCSHLLEEKIADLEEVVRDLRHELATSQRAANQKEENVNETINFLRAQSRRSSSSIPCPASHLLTCFQSSEEKIVNLEKVVRDLRYELTTASQKEKSLNETINSLVAQDEKSSTSNSILTSVIVLTSVRRPNRTTTTKSGRPRTHCSCSRAEAPM